MPKFDISLSASEIRETIRAIERYRIDIKRKTDELQRRLATLLRDESQNGFNNSVADVFTAMTGLAPLDAMVTVSIDTHDNVSVVVASGEDAVFVEFGAGVHFNGAAGSSPHPWGSQMGLTIGSYGPNGKKDQWAIGVMEGYGEETHHVWSHGTPAQRPMYNAMMLVADRVISIAREVFGDD